MNRHILTLAAALVAAPLALTLAQVAKAADPSPALQKVIDAAKKEGELTLSWLPTLFGEDGTRQLANGMNKMFGTNIKYTYTPDPGSLPQTLNKILVAQQANQPAHSDIYIGTTNHVLIVKQRNAAVPVKWNELMPGRITDRMVEAEGLAVKVFTTLPGGIIYNTRRAPSKPVYLTDLLKPEWKGKIATNPYAASFDNLATDDFWGDEKTLDFARKYSEQIAGMIGCGDMERVASGEFVAFAMDCIGRDWVALKRKGAPVEMVVPKDYAAQRYYYFMLPKNAAHPNAALLFSAFVLTSEGQKIIWNRDDTDLHLFPDSGMSKVIADYEKQGIVFKELSADWLAKQKDVRKTQEEVIKILRKS